MPVRLDVGGLDVRDEVASSASVWIGVIAVGGLLAVAGAAGAVYEDQFTWPMDGEITSNYWDCRDNCDRYHRAIDIADGCDTPIYASRAGTAEVQSDPTGYGDYVTVDHDDGWTTLYAHLDDVHVSDGEEVTRDTQLGDEGESGSATGCHVHFEIRQDDEGPSHEVKHFLPGQDGDPITRGDKIALANRVIETTTSTDVLDGPNVDDVPGEGDETIRSADEGERFATYSSWTNGAGETYHVVDVDGRAGWIADDDTTEVQDTTARVRVDTALNVRTGPGTSNTDVGNVYGAQAYPVQATDQDADGDPWLEIPYDHADGDEGWIHAGYATPVAHGLDGSLADREILLDPGHGGDDPGAESDGVDEKDVVLDIALEARDRLLDEGATVVLTRMTDKDVSLEDRTTDANDYEVDRFVSVHANSCGGCGADGTETYYHDSLSGDSEAANLSEEIQDAAVEEANTTDRGVKQENFHVLRESDMPASLLETAFIDDDGDRETLTSEEGQAAFARGIRDGVLGHFGQAIDDDPVDDPDPATRLDEGFEDPVDAWTISDESGSASWERTTERAGEGSYSMAIADYGADEDDQLTTPAIDLGDRQAPTLTLSSWMEGERACGVFGCTVYDDGTIEVSADGGSSWTVLEDEYWDSDGWETLSYDLSDYAGDTIEIRFTFTSDGATQNEGWYVDEVQILDADPLLEEGFESPVDGWTISDESGSASWERTTERAGEGSYSMAIADYGADEDDQLTTPAIDLGDRQAPTLTLSSWMEGERACGVFGCTVYDDGTIEVSADGGSSWTVLEDEYWDSDGWETLSYDLSDYAGDTIEIRFTFTSDGATQNEGWYVDAVEVG
jgi:N-acetylmuramoyl-L-alanine amidase